MIVQLDMARPTSIYEKNYNSLLIQEYWRAIILFEISTFFNPPAL